MRFDATAQLEIGQAMFDASKHFNATQTFGADEIRIAAGGQTPLALNIADQCLKYWDDFLRHHGLLP